MRYLFILFQIGRDNTSAKQFKVEVKHKYLTHFYLFACMTPLKISINFVNNSKKTFETL